MTEHEAGAVADETAATTGMDATHDDAHEVGETPSERDAQVQPTTGRKRRAVAAQPLLFEINVDDPELPSHTMPFAQRVEAAIMLADRPISDGRIAEVLGLVPPTVRVPKSADQGEAEDAPEPRDSALTAGRRKEAVRLVAEAVDRLNADYAETNRAFRIESVSGGRQMLTLPAFGAVITRMRGARAQARLSQPAIETLAIIAYRQPILRAQLEAIRGVACGEVLKSLVERRLVKIVGRSEELGRPMLYGTTPEFLRVFGIASLSDLPQAKDLR